MSTSDVTTSPVAARVQVIPAPIASPGHCVICGKSDHPEGFADARLDFEFYGTVYFCADCVGDFANSFNYLNPEQAIMLAKRVQELEKECAVQREALLLLEQSVDNLANYNRIRGIATESWSDASVSNPSDEGAEEITGTASNDVIQLADRIAKSEPDINEPVSEQGSSDISEPSSSNDATPIIPL